MGRGRTLAMFVVLGSAAGTLLGCGTSTTTADGALDADGMPPDAGTDGLSGLDCRVHGCPTDHLCVRGICLAQTDQDLDGIIAALDCDDGDPDIGTQGSRPCTRGCGTGTATCTRGEWGQCEFPEGTLEAFVDDFDDGVTASHWTPWTTTGTVLRETAGLLVATLAPAGFSTAGYRSEQTYELRDSCATLEIERVFLPDETAFGYLLLHTEAEETLEFMGDGGRLEFRVRYADRDPLDIPGPAFDPEAHRFWRIREADGTVFWEASSDGHDFRILAAHSLDIGATQVRVSIGAEAYEPQQDPGEFHVDGLNVPRPD